MKKLLLVLLIPFICFGKGFVSDSKIAQRKQRRQDIMSRAKSLTGRMNDQEPQDTWEAEEAPEMTSEVVLMPPERLMEISYQNSGKYVTKNDFNRVVDSLTRQFGDALDDIYASLDEMDQIDDELLGQSEAHHDRWETTKDFFFGGGATAFITAITGLIVVFKRKKKKVAEG